MKCRKTSSSPFSEGTAAAGGGRGTIQFPAAAPLTVASLDAQSTLRRPVRRKAYTPKEMLELFDRRETLYMVYIPHFLTQCIMHYIDALCDYTTRNRMPEYKSLKRTLAEVKAEYHAALRLEMPPEVYAKFLAQRDRYLEICGPLLGIVAFTFSNELARRFRHVDNDTVICHAFMIVSLARFIEEFDAAANRRIAQRLGMPAHNRKDARVSFVKDVCLRVVGKYDMEQTTQTRTAMEVMATKAKEMINQMLD